MEQIANICEKTLLLQNPILTTMYGRKRRLDESSSDDEDPNWIPKKGNQTFETKKIHEEMVDSSTDEEHNRGLVERVKELERSLATKTEEISKEIVKVSEDRKQLEKVVKENMRLMQRVKDLETSLAQG